MGLQCDQVELRSRFRRLKIRRAPSSATNSSSQSALIFHGCCRQRKKRCKIDIVSQPLLVYAFDPEIIETEPADFMWVVQMLTGSPDTCRSVRTRMSSLNEMHSTLQPEDAPLMQQGITQINNDLLKEGTTTIIAQTSFVNANLSINYIPASHSSPNPSDLTKNINYYPPELPLSLHANPLNCKALPSSLSPASTDLSNNISSHPLASSLSCETNELNLKNNHPEENKNHPLSPISSSRESSIFNLPFSPNDPKISPSTESSIFNLPFSPNDPQINQINSSHSPFSSSIHDIKLQLSSPSSPKPSKCNCFIIDKHSISLLSPTFCKCGSTTPMSARSSNSKYSDLPLLSSNCTHDHLAASPLSAKTSRESKGPPCSQVSLDCSLTTSSEDYHMDNFSIGGGASPYREAFCLEQGNTIKAEEDIIGSINFFVFSPDSYYGNDINAAQDEVEVHDGNILDFFSQSSISQEVLDIFSPRGKEAHFSLFFP